MDPNKPTDLTDMTGVHWLGRGRGNQPKELPVGRSRGLLLATEGSGRARGFLTPGNNSQGQPVFLPSPEPVFARGRGLLLQPDNSAVGRARGLLHPAAEPNVGVARGAVLPTLESKHGQSPPLETMTPAPTGHTPALAKQQISMQTHGQGSTLVSMFRGLGVEPMTSLGRGTLAVGLY
ncbi:piwi-like protein 2 [Leuresthes tenuis]|uniref:piwi-like protein 2 n=1 Tax=Leuresthes tenuis TaxID=355514 RepID=UPI003B50383C